MKYRNKPVRIEAVQYDGANMLDIISFTEGAASCVDENGKVLISTLEGVMKASTNDFIVKDGYGTFHPCKPDIFEKTYEIVE